MGGSEGRRGLGAQGRLFLLVRHGSIVVRDIPDSNAAKFMLEIQQHCLAIKSNDIDYIKSFFLPSFLLVGLNTESGIYQGHRALRRG